MNLTVIFLSNYILNMVSSIVFIFFIIEESFFNYLCECEFAGEVVDNSICIREGIKRNRNKSLPLLFWVILMNFEIVFQNICVFSLFLVLKTFSLQIE